MAYIKIYGAGMAGLLAGAILSKRHNVQIFEKKEKLEQTHYALLRFKDNSIEQTLGIKCNKVTIKKAIFYKNQLYNQSNIKLDNEYSYKVVENYSDRSIGDLSAGVRYIPPVDFYSKLVQINKNIINYGQEFDKDKINKDDIIISTIPMSNIYTMVHPQELKFDYCDIGVYTTTIENCNLQQTIYFPQYSFDMPAYRISIINNKCILETAGEHKMDNIHDVLINQIYLAFGIIKSHISNKFVYNSQKYGKIINIDECARQSILYNLTHHHNIYSLGRFACWRNHIMLSDVVQDIFKIENWINQKEYMSPYEIQKSI